MAKAKAKSKAMPRVPQSREDAVWALGRIGTLRRMITSAKATADEANRLIGETFEAEIAPLAEELAEHEKGLQTYCEANRNVLTNDGKVKYHDFGTGQINWKFRPPKVTIRNIEGVIDQIKRVGFAALFVRVKEEINKEAMLAEPDKARLLSGVTISSEGEEFAIVPAELDSSLARN